MRDLVLLTAIGAATALATGLGAIPVFLLGKRAEALRPMLGGAMVGLMTVASIVGLIRPALKVGSSWTVAGGPLVGGFFLAAARRFLKGRDVHVGELRGSGVRTAVLVFAVLFIHSLPEGFAIGTAYASSIAGLSLFVILAIALQNIPEGTSIAAPMAAVGFGRKQQFWRRLRRVRPSRWEQSSPFCSSRASPASFHSPLPSRQARC